MKPVVKGFLIGCSILLILGIAAVVAVMVYINRNAERLMAKGEAVQADATQFGAKVAEPACVAEMSTRYKKSPGFMAAIEQGVWLQGCLQASTFSSGFCDGVPPESEIMQSANWRVERCGEIGLRGDSVCPSLFAEMQKYCYGPERKRKAGAGN